jgi:asparagine synthase (glutamine-hydrolysing)
MCGIFAILNNNNSLPRELINSQFQKGKKRGPEHSTILDVGIKVIFGFHRLAINGLNPESNQPIQIGNIQVICNGEIYNYRELYKMMNIVPETDSDCEVIIHLYIKYGIDHTLHLLDGVFSFLLLDNDLYSENSKLFVARDPYGVRPLYSLNITNSNKKHNPFSGNTQDINEAPNPIIGFASELKMLSELCIDCRYNIEHFMPGTYALYTLSTKVHANWTLDYKQKYHINAFCSTSVGDSIHSEEKINNFILDNKISSNQTIEIYMNIQKLLVNAVEKRCSTTSRPIACLLSGGLDSSLITALVCNYHKKHGLSMPETYSIGLKNSTDLKYAKEVADYLGTKHNEIVIEEHDFCDALSEVIYAIESYDTTTVRASIGNYLLGKYIASVSEAKVIFNGDGADELMGGYLYMKKSPDEIEFDRECRRLLSDIYMFDVLRSDRSISSHGLEPRTPFLDRAFTQYYLSLPPNVRFHGKRGEIEKYLVRNAFSPTFYKNTEDCALLPMKILFRKKEAFSDGVSGKNRSLFHILGDFANKEWDKFVNDLGSDMSMFSIGAMKMKLLEKEMEKINYPKTVEQKYYRLLFENAFNGLGKTTPYFWMPRYIEATDASARTLAIYDN